MNSKLIEFIEKNGMDVFVSGHTETAKIMFSTSISIDEEGGLKGTHRGASLTLDMTRNETTVTMNANKKGSKDEIIAKFKKGISFEEENKLMPIYDDIAGSVCAPLGREEIDDLLETFQ